MSQAEALLNSLSETVVDHKHVVPDSDAYFIIDPYTRQIENTTYNKTVLMRGDHNSERFTFELPRYVDGHDMSLCNRVIVHFDNVGDSIENVYSDVAYMDDLRLNPDNPETVISSWLIRREATQIVGILSFSLQYQCVEEGEITYEWNTDSYDDIEIRKSKNNGEAAVINYTNVLEQWRSQIFGAGDSVMANISAEGASQVTAVKSESATQQAAIELKGSETLASIPEDYTEVYNMAEEALRTKADGVVCEAEGEIVTLSDSSDDYLRGLKVYGKTTQADVPSPDTPQELESVVDPVIKIHGKNLISPSDIKIIDSITTKHSGVASLKNGCPLVDGQVYTVSFDTENTGIEVYINTISGFSEYKWFNMDGKRKTFTLTYNTPSATDEWLHLVSRNSETSDIAAGAISNIQIEIGDTATEYEPYSEQVITLAYTLSGIPVTSGGNYTDENGQQWICDEIDFERGVHVQRIMQVTYDGSSDENWSCYNEATDNKIAHFYHMVVNYARIKGTSVCNCLVNVNGAYASSLYGAFGDYDAGNVLYFTAPNADVTNLETMLSWLQNNPLEIIYILATPIETPLSQDEIEAYKTLKTNYPNTTILNNSGAWTKVKYNADIKLYAEKDKQKLAADIIDQLRDNVTPARIGVVTLVASAWEGKDNLYSQVVNIDGVTENSQVDLTPNIEQLVIFYDKDISFVTENDGGVVTIYAVGQKPTNDYTIQVTITEVEV